MATSPTETVKSHTPGPWEVDHENDVIVRDADGNRIADCDVFQYTDDGEIQLEDCPANARLIAAAPELLEALEAIIFAVDPEGEGTFDAAHNIAANRPSNGELVLKGSFIERCIKARAAITKAVQS